MQNFKYQFKILINEKTMLFWAVLFPLILATFFNLAFSNLTSSEKFDVVKVAIVEEEKNDDFKKVIIELSKAGDKQLLDVSYTNKTEANKLLEDDKISGYLVINQEIGIVVKSNGLSQTIIKTIVDKYYQTSSTISNIYKLNPSSIATGILEDLNSSKNNFNDISNKNMDLTVVYFYTLIGMTCLYGSFWGLKVVTKNEANLSKQGARINMSPTPKIKNLGIGLIVAFIIQYLSMLILMGYLVFGLNISFGSQTNYILLLMAVGSFVGISFGNLVGNVLKTSENTKISVLSTVSLLFSFFAGMMIVDIKYFIQEYFPIGAYINPVSLITDALYSLYYYTNNDRYFFNLLCLLIFGIIITSISFLFMRRKKYDSI